MKKCPQCLGKGEEYCPVCRGSRKNPSSPDRACNYCDGKGYIKCNVCMGTGKLDDDDDYRRS